MKIKISLFLCLFCFGADAKMAPMTPEQIKNQNIKTFNTEVSRNLIHLAHGNWNDEIVKGHTTPEFFKKYPSGKFLDYVPYGQLMSFEGVYAVDESKAGQTTVRAIAAFELQKVDVQIDYKFIDGRYLIDAITITPIAPNDQKLIQVNC